MIKKDKPGSAPKLKAMAGCTRALYPWLLEECHKMLDPSNGIDAAILEACVQFNRCCTAALSKSRAYPRAAMKEHGQKWVLLYNGLAQRDPAVFRIKPKMHLFLHMLEDGDIRASWTYKDEDWGGTVSRMARRRGGVMTQKAFSCAVLDRFRCDPFHRQT